MDYEKLGVFYLGRVLAGAGAAQSGGEPLLLASNDLTTHGVVVGMTGSGKTGLCLSIVEEAAIDGIPVLAIDPKGDLANVMLAFPAMRGADLLPWIDPDTARRAGTTAEAFAEQEAAKMRAGLAESGQSPERIARMRAAADFAVFTPGSDAGIPLAVLRSLEPPPQPVRQSVEALRERVESTTSALLGLAGIEADPVTSREHVLVANLLAHAWAAGRGFDLASLVAAIRHPPFTAIGVLDLDTFYPEKERFSLVMALNNLLASPAAATLMHGAPLDVDRLLYSESGKPRVAVVSIAHLGDAERKAFVTLLLGNVVSWMRAQPGTSTLRALLFMDEVAGYLPPVASPPTKPLFLTLFKQARAFGLGVIVATQNPVDVDYKVLSNAGTWMVGRLATARDRSKVLEGLVGAAEAAGSAASAEELEKALAALDRRQFLLASARGAAPTLFTTRQTLGYLRGPMSLADLARLGQARGAAQASATQTSSGAAAARPMVPPEIGQIFVPLASATVEPLHGPVGYAPSVLGVARVRHVDKKLGIDTTTVVELAGTIEDTVVGVDWARAHPLYVPPEQLETTPREGSLFSAIPPAGLNEEKHEAWRKAFVEFLLRAFTVELFACKEAKLVSMPRESERDFRVRLGVKLLELRDAEIGKIREKYASKVRTAQEKLRKAEQAVIKEQQEVSQRQGDAMLTVGTSVLGAIFSNRALSAANVQRAGRAVRGVKKATSSAEDVQRANENLAAARAALAALEAEIAEKARTAAGSLNPATIAIDRATVAPKKTGIEIVAFGLGWLPYRANATGAWDPAWPR